MIEVIDTMLKGVIDSLVVLADAFTVVASGIAVYIFLTKRRQITSVFQLLMKYGYQVSLSELRSKLDMIANLRVADEKQREQIKYIMSEVVGQIQGNPRLKTRFEEELKGLERFATGKKAFSEPEKRMIVAKLREKLRHLDMENIDGLTGERK